MHHNISWQIVEGTWLLQWTRTQPHTKHIHMARKSNVKFMRIIYFFTYMHTHTEARQSNLLQLPVFSLALICTHTQHIYIKLHLLVANIRIRKHGGVIYGYSSV